MTNMVLTALEAQVEERNVPKLTEAFVEAVAKLDPGIAETFLVRASKDPRLWRILTLWLSRESLDAMRQTGETPRGVLIFRAAGAEPVLTLFDIVARGVAPA